MFGFLTIQIVREELLSVKFQTLLLLSICMFSISVPAESEFPLDTYLPVTDYRLLNPEPENWLQWRGNYQGWTYSPLEQINSDNVEDLRVAWVYSTDASGAHQAPPIVNNGYMFVGVNYSTVTTFAKFFGISGFIPLLIDK